MAGVPEGQIPRDGAFWRTYHAVEAEHAQALARMKCSDEGHALTLSGSEGWSGCDRCGASADTALRDMGFVSEGDHWVQRACT